MKSKVGILTKKFGLKVKIERTKRGLSQLKLAEMTSISTTSIGAIERGESSPTLETIGVLADAFKMSLPELIDINKVEL